ncbi:MAG: endonuclease/exonuclease/phosphatase family protein [Candidatus Accumulibacter sp.]|nr:endonuclease/exonuclease/phosphatase family protein [Accumulibacter sp.]
MEFHFLPLSRSPFFSTFRSALRDYASRYAHRRAILIAMAALVGWTGNWHWLPELFSHAFYQYALALPALTLLVFYGNAKKYWRWTTLVAMVLVWFPFMLSFLTGPSDTRPNPPKTRITLLQFNTLRKTEPLAKWLASRARDVDVVLALEVDTPFSSVIEAFSGDFPYHIERFSEDSFGIALISRYPFAQARILDTIDPIFPAVDTVLITPSGPLRLVGIHPPPPVSAEGAALRNHFMEELSVSLESDLPTVVFGDFNSTPWSPKLRAFLSRNGLEDAQRGHGMLSTWPAQLARYADFLGVPIDLTLLSPSLTVESRQSGPFLDSDHLPVITRIRY